MISRRVLAREERQVARERRGEVRWTLQGGTLCFELCYGDQLVCKYYLSDLKEICIGATESCRIQMPGLMPGSELILRLGSKKRLGVRTATGSFATEVNKDTKISIPATLNIGRYRLSIAQPETFPRLSARVEGLPILSYALLQLPDNLGPKLWLTNHEQFPIDVEVRLIYGQREQWATFYFASDGELTPATEKLCCPTRQNIDGLCTATSEGESISASIWIGDKRIVPSVTTAYLYPPTAWCPADHPESLAILAGSTSRAVIATVEESTLYLQRLTGFTSWSSARGWLDEATGDKSERIRRVELLLRAIYYCLQEGGATGRDPISYSFELISTNDTLPQMIRLPDEIHHGAHSQGTCIDLALFFAACVERALGSEYAPVIIIGGPLLPSGELVVGTYFHAVLGFWTRPGDSDWITLRDDLKLRQLFQSHDLLISDSVGIAQKCASQTDQSNIAVSWRGTCRSGHDFLFGHKDDDGNYRHKLLVAINLRGARCESIFDYCRTGKRWWSPDARQLLAQALHSASGQGAAQVTSYHLLEVLLTSDFSSLPKCLSEPGYLPDRLTLETLIAETQKRKLPMVQPAAYRTSITESYTAAYLAAESYAEKRHAPVIQVSDVILGFLDGPGLAAEWLKTCVGAYLQNWRNYLRDPSSQERPT